MGRKCFRSVPVFLSTIKTEEGLRDKTVVAATLFTATLPSRSGFVSVADENADRLPFVSLRSVGLDLRFSVLFVVGLHGQARGHSGCLHHCFEAALSLLDVLLRVEDDHVDLGYVEHAQGHGGAQAHGHGQGRRLDEHLQ